MLRSIAVLFALTLGPCARQRTGALWLLGGLIAGMACGDSRDRSQLASPSGDADERDPDDAAGDDTTSPASAHSDGGPTSGGSTTRDAGPTVRDAGSAGARADADAADATTGADAGAPSECNGKPLPPRAQGSAGPFAIGPEAAGLPAYWPTDGFRSEQPEALGFDPAQLSRALDYETPYSNTQAILIVRHGYLAAEKYWAGFGANSTHESYSMAKSVASALVGIAIAEGRLASTEEKVCRFYPAQWDCDDASDPRSRITIAHAMNLTTGLSWREDWRSNASGPNDAFGLNLLDTVLARPALEEPGTSKRYSTGDPALLSGMFESVTEMTTYAYAKQKIFDVIGASSVRWNADFQGRTTTYAGIQATARDYAKFGYLYLQHGRWDGSEVVPSPWVDQTTRAADLCEDWNQWLWHVNLPVRLGAQDPACPSLYCPPTELANLPPDGFFAEGVNGQFIFVVPSADLVAVRLADDMPGIEHWDDYARRLLEAILDAIR